MAKHTTTATAKQGGRRASSDAKGVTRSATGKGKSATGVIKMLAPTAIYHATPHERVKMIRKGVPATCLVDIIREMDISKERLYTTLDLPRSTIDNNIRNKVTLSAAHSERVIGLERLIGQVAVMVEQSGNSRRFRFDAARWVGEWLERPLSALGGEKPANFMDTMEGQNLVSKLLAQSQSGAYA